MKKLKYLVAPVLVGVIFIFGLNKYLDSSINTMLKEKNLTPIRNDALSNVKDKGGIINDYFLNKGDIMMLGSSELGHSTVQHPTYYFNTNRSKNQIFTIGRAYTQDLQDATILGSVNPDTKDKKVVLLISMQWFMDKKGVTKHHYQTRFSPVQFYKFLDNPKISEKNKNEFVNKAKKLLIGAEEFKPEAMYAKLYNPKNIMQKMEKVLLTPYFKCRQYIVKLKDKGTLYEELVQLPNKKNNKTAIPIDWKKEEEKAIKDAQKRVGKNELHIDKGYYKKYFGDGLNKKKDLYKDVNLMNSDEFSDYEFSLDVCKNLGIKPIVVMIPAMEKYYNLAGISTSERHAFYDKAEKLAKDKGFTVMDLRDKENELYYLRDVMHLGTKGWLDVCEKLFKEFDQQ